MKLPTFLLENYFVPYEFTAKYLLCCSDMESYSLNELLELADDEGKKLWRDLSLGYTETKGAKLLLEEIAKTYEKISSDMIQTFSGIEEAIFVSANVLLETGDHAVVVTPCYQSLKEVAKSIGANISLYELKEKNNWQLEISELKKLVNEKTKVLIVNFPHNPTGALLSKEEQKELVAFAKEKNIFLISDEAYRCMEIDPSDQLPAMADLYEKAVSISGLSKPYGLAGLRVGWIVSQDKNLVERIHKFRHYTTICSSAPSEVLGIIGLRARQKILERSAKIAKDNLKILEAFFERYKKYFSWVRPKGGCIGLVKIHLPIGADELSKRAIKKSGVLLLPGSIYEMDDHFFRIGFGRKSFPEALKQFEKFLVDEGLVA